MDAQALSQETWSGEPTLQAFIEKDIRQGHREGYREGEARVLLWQVQAKFDPLEPAVEARIQRAEPAPLERWLERILTAKNLDEWFGCI